ncbi:MAG: D-2-hydroxyacid dehydrogenase [Actinomycetota bacterium]
MNDRPVVVVLGTGPEDPPPGIDAAAADVELRYARDGAALPDALGGADALFFWRAEGAWLRDAWPHTDRLRWVQSASDGVDALMFPELVASDVEVTNARGVFEDAIAEWVVGAMLSFAARILDQRDRQARGVWDSTSRERLAGSRLLVVGPGPIGRATAVRARALGMEVEAAGRAARRDDLFGAVVATDDAAAFRAALGRADHVLDALPLTPATRGLFDVAVFAAMRPTARFYNVGRGATVNEPALIDAIEGGGIAGAGLDVFVEEPLSADSPLWTMSQVLLSPHMCGDVEGWEEEVVGIFVDNAARFARGEPLRNRVDTSAGFGVG